MFTNLAIERGPHIVVYHHFFLAELHIFSASLGPDGCQAFVQALKDGKQRPGCVAGLVFFLGSSRKSRLTCVFLLQVVGFVH